MYFLLLLTSNYSKYWHALKIIKIFYIIYSKNETKTQSIILKILNFCIYKEHLNILHIYDIETHYTIPQLVLRDNLLFNCLLSAYFVI